MHAGYGDIKDKIHEEPQWYDEHGCPRYCKFEPNMLANPYAEEAVLLLISCQECSKPFKVAMSADSIQLFEAEKLYGEKGTILSMINTKMIHYGDPPMHGGTDCSCSAGYCMNCNDDKVLEYWSRNNIEWIEKKKLRNKKIGDNSWMK